MKLSKFVSSFGIGSIAVAIAITLSSCTPKITEEQMQLLKELRGKDASLTESIQKKQGEKRKLEQEVNARKSELKKCQDDKAFIMDKLSKWPNCWPDYTPEPEQK